MQIRNLRLQGQAVLRYYFHMELLEGLVALILLINIPADPKNAVFMGFSTRRIAMAFGLLMFVLLFLGLTIKSLKDDIWLEALVRNLSITGTDLVLLFFFSLLSLE